MKRKKNKKKIPIKPCPFCGAFAEPQRGFTGMFMFICHNCGADVAFYGAEQDLEKALDKWNSRCIQKDEAEASPTCR